MKKNILMKAVASFLLIATPLLAYAQKKWQNPNAKATCLLSFRTIHPTENKSVMH